MWKTHHMGLANIYYYLLSLVGRYGILNIPIFFVRSRSVVNDDADYSHYILVYTSFQ